jgi:hypothetical protein
VWIVGSSRAGPRREELVGGREQRMTAAMMCVNTVVAEAPLAIVAIVTAPIAGIGECAAMITEMAFL